MSSSVGSERPCRYCGFVASRMSDEDCPAKPGRDVDEVIKWRVVGGWRVAVVGMAVAGRHLQAVVADDLHVIQSVVLSHGGSMIWSPMPQGTKLRDSMKAIEAYLRREVNSP